jgi:hypothetical protein
MTNVKKADYSNTIIYKIQCNDPLVTELYIGHTTDFIARKGAHKNSCNNKNNGAHSCKVYKVIRDNKGWDNWNMMIIAFKNCDGLASAKKLEQQYYETYKATLNSVEPSPKPVEKIQKDKMHNLKNSDKYVCVKCNFKCRKKSNFLKHEMTPKHNMTTDGNKVINRKMPHTCNCRKEYKYASGLSRHKQHCVVDTNDVIYVEEKCDMSINMGQTNDKESLILALITQNKELMNLLASQQQEHKEERKEHKEETKELLNRIQGIVEQDTKK